MEPYLIWLDASTAQADKLKERRRGKGIPACGTVKFNYQLAITWAGVELLILSRRSSIRTCNSNHGNTSIVPYIKDAALVKIHFSLCGRVARHNKLTS